MDLSPEETIDRRCGQRLLGSLRGVEVRALRKDLGLTQAEAAIRMGIARTTLVAIEHGRRAVSDVEFAGLRAH
jgi:DNA-binding XRE family transcriptional regulator